MKKKVERRAQKMMVVERKEDFFFGFVFVRSDFPSNVAKNSMYFKY